MSDPLLFVYGCIVSLVAGAGIFLSIYPRFRAEYVHQNPLARRREGPASSPAKAERSEGTASPARPAGAHAERAGR